ncbi:bacillithiol biosynthesis deacetylase BshB1 [Flavilitoribacter nigricans]|uniref:Bacillithiol biosynthesis deacetylase BshB1 n=1 Tax=Flavilitoribacter nigricans (strain ATCC 23147 / DSM 23189 / NBRC 102662 / NCIMB 1420 / SS-2) TaxID=1122177 RepID=A0A2D0N0D8_FLAN2|nr:bacillithiol biosynthesis deacetylase BshB1 [Flavilitoribacter nigricans]PHN01173.1 bacillithiol biosynthesis deacetylase BshB1 [Flavilitoribacter nigricans DSM 23189 = NBRC 102662]
MQKVDILAIGVHPDDVELSCSGTLLKHIAQGKTVGLLDLTRGELGTRGSAEIRDTEAANAAELMGAAFRVNLEMADGFFQYTKENIIRIAEVIRSCQPKIVLANAVHDRHPDHGRAAKLISDACFFSGLQKITTYDAQGQPHDRWRPDAVYHYIQDRNLKPDFVVDISDFIDKKVELILAYRSQFYLPDAEEYAEELDSPISGKDFLDFLKSKAAAYGRDAGFTFAEGFTVERTPGVLDLFDLV